MGAIIEYEMVPRRSIADRQGNDFRNMGAELVPLMSYFLYDVMAATKADGCEAIDAAQRPPVSSSHQAQPTTR